MDTHRVNPIERIPPYILSLCIYSNEPSISTTGRTASDALFELSVRADSALKTALCENDATVMKTNDRLTLRKSVSVMNQKQKAGSGRSLIRAKSDMANSDSR